MSPNAADTPEVMHFIASWRYAPKLVQVEHLAGVESEIEEETDLRIHQIEHVVSGILFMYVLSKRF